MSDELKPITAADTGFDAEEPNTRGILILTAGTIVLFVLVLVGITYYFNHRYEQQEYEALLAPPSEELANLRRRDEWNLTHYAYRDKAKGQVRIPIERAMELLVKEAAEGKLHYPTVDQAPKKVEPVVQASAGAGN
jgi:uncharacterized iron-regulated membrane protein